MMRFTSTNAVKDTKVLATSLVALGLPHGVTISDANARAGTPTDQWFFGDKDNVGRDSHIASEIAAKGFGGKFC